MTDHTAEKAQTWRDYCKHNGPCVIAGADRCTVPDDPAYVAAMESRFPTGMTPGGEQS